MYMNYVMYILYKYDYKSMLYMYDAGELCNFYVHMYIA